MRKVTLITLVVLAFLGSVVAAQALSVRMDAQPALVVDAPATVLMAGPPFGPIPHCGDYCSTPGQSRGCIDDSGPSWKKVECTCASGPYYGNTWHC